MSCKDWNKDELISNGKRLKELITLCLNEVKSNKLTDLETIEYLTAIAKAELALNNIRNEYKKRI